MEYQIGDKVVMAGTNGKITGKVVRTFPDGSVDVRVKYTERFQKDDPRYKKAE